MSKELVLFSSDSSELYKWDIYRSLVLPKNYIIQFRYQKDEITPDILSDYKSYINREGIIFFAAGNKPEKPKNERNIQLISIRHVAIKEIIPDNQINTLNFYLELGDFCDCSPIEETERTELPPDHFVSLVNLYEGTKPEWKRRVDAVVSSFPGTIFYYIEAIKHKGDILNPVYSYEDRRTVFELSDEDEYQMCLSIYNPRSEEILLGSEKTSEFIETSISNTNTRVSSVDTQIHKITTHSLTKKKASERIVITQKKLGISNDEELKRFFNNEIELWFNIARSKKKVLNFGLLSAIAATGLLGTSIATKSPALFEKPWPLIFGVGSIIMIGGVASLLFDLFNKK